MKHQQRKKAQSHLVGDSAHRIKFGQSISASDTIWLQLDTIWLQLDTIWLQLDTIWLQSDTIWLQ